MSNFVTKSFRISEHTNERLLAFAELNSLRPSEVIRASLAHFIGPTYSQKTYYKGTLEASDRAILENDCNTFEAEPRAQECSNHKYNTVSKKRNTKEKKQSTPKTLSNSKTSTSKTSTDSVTIPDSLDCPQFRQAWTDFIAHRKEIKKPITQRAQAMTLKRLSKVSTSEAIEAIEASIANGWQGVEPDWTKNRNNSHQSNRIEGPSNDPNYYDDPV